MTETFSSLINTPLHFNTKENIAKFISGFETDVINKSFSFDSEDDNEMENIQLLKLEVKQLKRQNAFLKRKIQQLKSFKHHAKGQNHKKQSLNCANVLKKKTQLLAKNTHNDNSLNFILTEVQNILKSLATIHKLQINDRVWLFNENKLKEENCEQILFPIKINDQYKKKLFKDLELIALQTQSSRYSSLLKIFTEFYQFHYQDQKWAKTLIEKHIQKSLQISKQLIQRAQFLQMSQKITQSSCIFTKRSAPEQSQCFLLKGKENCNSFQNSPLTIHN